MKHSASLLSIVSLALAMGVGRGWAGPADNEGVLVVMDEANSLRQSVNYPQAGAGVQGVDAPGMLGDISRVVEEIERVLEGVVDEMEKVVEGVERVVGKAGERVEKWMEGGREFVREHGHTYELFTHPQFKDHSLRVTKPTLCDPDVKQYSGYLDITDGKHLFFWFFEARNSPKTAPLLMWLNGGPGCSSMTGLLFENGPCRVSNEGFNTTNNPYSWNTDANMIFLDQPINVGYSYSDDGSTVNTTPVAGLDVYAFLELFLTHFKKYADAPFHLAAESYGGTYAPHFAAEIHARNKALDQAPSSKGLVKINLASVILANGHTDPLLQFPTIPTFACEGPYPIYDDPEGAQCQALRSKVPTCERLVKACYDYGSRLTCVPATLYCNSQLWAPIQQLGLNPYDVRKKCNREEDGSLCYKEMLWLDTWMNIDENKKLLGVDPSRKFESCNMQVNQAFLTQGDSSHNSAPFLIDLINEGVRVLVYAGNADYMCNFIGNEAWLLDLDTIFKAEFNAAKVQPWVTLDGGKVAGVVRSAGGNGFGAGNVTFVAVHEAGHMVPYDQPEHAFDLITRWLGNVPLSLNATETTQVMFGGW